MVEVLYPPFFEDIIDSFTKISEIVFFVSIVVYLGF